MQSINKKNIKNQKKNEKRSEDTTVR
jgi:hypothetical protein